MVRRDSVPAGLSLILLITPVTSSSPNALEPQLHSFSTFKKLVENLSDDLKKNDIINFVLFFCGCWMCMFVCFFCLCYEYLT